jgi:hypothetical protein
MTDSATPTGQLVYDPRGDVEAEALPIAKGASNLLDLKLGVLDNTKWNGRRLLEKIVARIQGDGPFTQVTYYQKEGFSRNASPELLDRIASENDVVITAIGD